VGGNNDLANEEAIMTVRSVSRVIRGVPTLEGAGFLVHRPFPSGALADFDPFLLLDEMGPMNVGPGEAKGAPDHPHRGFETVTYMLSGSFRHKDSHGHEGKLEPGDVQWMTAGQGVVHSEEPSKEFQRSGGTLHGVQLWVNLPRKDKMTRPHYQEIPARRIPSAQTPDGKVTARVLAGESLGARAVIETRTPIFYLDVTLKPGGEISQPVALDFNAFAYVIDGPALFSSDTTHVERGNMVAFHNDGDEVHVRAPLGSESSARVLLIGGRPLNEPIARYGPFVMNTSQEIQEAFDDYRSGRMGAIDF
jgi:redox-sensitive bicupin YhaK (pirin superfamily)